MASPELKIDPHILAAELSKLFGLELTANMITRDGWFYESGSDGRGILKVTLMKAVNEATMKEVMRNARSSVTVHHHQSPYARCDDRCLPDCPGRGNA